MKQEVIQQILKDLKEKFLNNKVIDVVFNEKSQEFYLIFENGLEIEV